MTWPLVKLRVSREVFEEIKLRLITADPSRVMVGFTSGEQHLNLDGVALECDARDAADPIEAIKRAQERII